MIGRTYKNYIDGYNMLDYLSKAGTFETIDDDIAACPRKEFIYTTDGGEVCAIRVHDWKATYLENRANRLQIWREPFIKLRTPHLYNLRRDPFEKAQIGSNTYEDWFMDKVYLLAPMQVVASKFLMTMKDYPPSQTPGDWSLETLEKQIKVMAPSTR